jgi:acid phosphatase family membrane protein YuiD
VAEERPEEELTLNAGHANLTIMMNFPLFLVPVLVGLIAQSLKPLFNKQLYAQLEAGGHQIPRYGGMPSAHTAFAFSLATVIAMTQGFNSADFAIAATAVIFIVDDALRMRIFLSRHGEALHRLVDRLPAAEQKDFPYLEKRLGHKTSEAIAGAILGIVLSWVFMMIASAL